MSWVISRSWKNGMSLRTVPILIVLAIFALTGCAVGSTQSGFSSPNAASTNFVDKTAQDLITATTTHVPTSTAVVTPFPQPTRTPTTSPTPGLYDSWSIQFLRQRAYGDGNFDVLEILAENSYFTRYRIRYTSDGLDIYGFMNLPNEGDSLPVVIAIHGYIEPEVYTTLDYTTRYADDLTRRGFAVIHPNLRNYPPSDSGENLFRVGMAIDVLNLVSIIRKDAGRPGPFEKIDSDRIELWGHSMGGGISTRVMTIDPKINAVLLYSAMSGDERQNFEAINRWSDGQRGLEELEVPSEYYEAISPEYFFSDIQSAVSIHHGLADELVPVRWSQETCAQLTSLEKTVECVYYKDMPHTFWGSTDQLFMEKAAIFFQTYLVQEAPNP